MKTFRLFRIKAIDSMMAVKVMADLKEETFVLIRGTIVLAVEIITTVVVMTSRTSVDVTN